MQANINSATLYHIMARIVVPIHDRRRHRRCGPRHGRSSGGNDPQVTRNGAKRARDEAIDPARSRRIVAAGLLAIIFPHPKSPSDQSQQQPVHKNHHRFSEFCYNHNPRLFLLLHPPTKKKKEALNFSRNSPKGFKFQVTNVSIPPHILDNIRIQKNAKKKKGRNENENKKTKNKNQNQTKPARIKRIETIDRKQNPRKTLRDSCRVPRFLIYKPRTRKIKAFREIREVPPAFLSFPSPSFSLPAINRIWGTVKKMILYKKIQSN